MLSRTSKRALALVAAVVIYQATAAAYQPAVEDDCMDQCMANRENCRAWTRRSESRPIAARKVDHLRT